MIDEDSLKFQLLEVARQGDDAVTQAWIDSLAPEEREWLQRYFEMEVVPELNKLAVAFQQFLDWFMEVWPPIWEPFVSAIAQARQWMRDNHILYHVELSEKQPTRRRPLARVTEGG